MIRSLRHVLLALLLSLGLVPGLGALVEHAAALVEHGHLDQDGHAGAPSTVTLEGDAAPQLLEALAWSEPPPPPRPGACGYGRAADQVAPARRAVAPPRPPPDPSV